MPSAQNIQKKLGDTIRSLRLNQGYSQDEFAHLCGLHRTYYGAVERGERNISLNNIVKIASSLELTAASLFEKSKL